MIVSKMLREGTRLILQWWLCVLSQCVGTDNYYFSRRLVLNQSTS